MNSILYTLYKQEGKFQREKRFVNVDGLMWRSGAEDKLGFRYIHDLNKEEYVVYTRLFGLRDIFLDQIPAKYGNKS